jgi:MinD superfamily P-loop ATPase
LATAPAASPVWLLIYNDSVPTTEDMNKKLLPVFSLKRCKRCGICRHFCPTAAIEVQDGGAPVLAKPEACTSCGLCSDMCPDWAVCLTAADNGEAVGLARERERANDDQE